MHEKFVAGLNRGVAGTAEATVLSQAISGIGIAVYTLVKLPELRVEKSDRHPDRETLRRIVSYSSITCEQQSVMNFGILMIQGLVNSFGTVIMAAFAVTVKFDRIRKGVRGAYAISIAFCVLVSVLVWVFAEPLIAAFLDQPDPQIIAAGIRYLHIEGSFYCGIGCLFLFYGLYRALNRPLMSFVLTVISLGTRVVLAYALAPVPKFGVSAVWWAIPIG